MRKISSYFANALARCCHQVGNALPILWQHLANLMAEMKSYLRCFTIRMVPSSLWYNLSTQMERSQSCCDKALL